MQTVDKRHPQQDYREDCENDRRDQDAPFLPEDVGNEGCRSPEQEHIERNEPQKRMWTDAHDDDDKEGDEQIPRCSLLKKNTFFPHENALHFHKNSR